MLQLMYLTVCKVTVVQYNVLVSSLWKLQTLNEENMGLYPVLPFWIIGKFIHHSLLQFAQNEYLAIDSDGFLHKNNRCALILALLDYSQKSWDGVWFFKVSAKLLEHSWDRLDTVIYKTLLLHCSHILWCSLTVGAKGLVHSVEKIPENHMKAQSSFYRWADSYDKLHVTDPWPRNVTFFHSALADFQSQIQYDMVLKTFFHSCYF